MDNPTLIQRIITYNAQQRLTPVPVPPVPPVTPPTPPVVVPAPTPEPHAWQKLLTDEQRALYSRVNVGEFSLFVETMKRMGELLDEAYKP